MCPHLTKARDQAMAVATMEVEEEVGQVDQEEVEAARRHHRHPDGTTSTLARSMYRSGHMCTMFKPG